MIDDEMRRGAGPLPHEPLTIEQRADDQITLGCSACGGEARSSMEPADRLLDAIHAFATTHTHCR